jgi:glyoxylase-like metal-dependent hydrolase (beta-lactamase superfamily II)
MIHAEVIELASSYKNEDVLIFPTVLKVDEKIFLVDCGYEETFDDLISLLRHKNIDVAKLHGILVSHDDIDHVGALHLLKALNPDIRIYASAIEEPSLSGKTKSERLEQAERMFSFIPEEHKAWALDFQQSLQNIKRVPVDQTLTDLERIEGEVQVIHTPGHTRGHLSFYVPMLKTLIAGDAFVIDRDAFDIANPQFTLDLPAAIDSIRKLKDLDIDTVICYHGGRFQGDIRKKLLDLLEKYNAGD